MTEFKVGDFVLRTGISQCGLRKGTVYKVSRVSGQLIELEGYRGLFSSNQFAPFPKAPELPVYPALNTILQMDRVLYKSGVPSTALNEYLDKPLSAFVTDIMEPRGISLIDNRRTSY